MLVLRVLQGLLAVADVDLRRLRAGAAILLAPILIVRGPYLGPGLGHPCRLGAAAADTTAARPCTGPDPGRAQGVHLLADVGAGVAVDDRTIARTGGEAPAVEVTAATTVGAEAEAANGAEDSGPGHKLARVRAIKGSGVDWQVHLG